MRAVLVVLSVMLCGSALADGPLTTKSVVPLGVNPTHKWFAAVDQSVRGTVTKFTPVAYAFPKWRKARIRLRSFVIDNKDEVTQTASMGRAEKNIATANESFSSYGVVEASPIKGGFTGRYRIPEMGMVVYVENDQVIARTGDISIMKKLVLVKSLNKLSGKCKGKQSGKILHVVANKDWHAVGVYVQSTCEPDSETTPGRRVQKLIVKDVAKIL